MLDGKVPEPRTLQSRVGFDLLPLKSRPGFQAAFVEQFRIEGADERMKPPCLVEEETSVGRNRGMMSENMIQGRNTDPIGVASLNRLLELTRISQKHDAFRSLRDCHNVCQGHLAICAASSMNNTSTLSRASGRAQKYDVPPPTGQFVRIASRACSFFLTNCKLSRSFSRCLSSTF